MDKQHKTIHRVTRKKQKEKEKRKKEKEKEKKVITLKGKGTRNYHKQHCTPWHAYLVQRYHSYRHVFHFPQAEMILHQKM